MDTCVYCKIIAGEIPAVKVYEDERVLAFLDIRPIAEGHTLVVSKVHVPRFLDLPEDDYVAVAMAVQRIGRKIRSAFNPVRVGLLVKGFDVDHTHYHLFPMNKDADIISGTYGHEMPPLASQEEREAAAQKIKDAQD